MRYRRPSKRGQTLVIALGVMLVLLIMVPVMVTVIMNENRWAVASKKGTTAFYLAEAGIDRGYWKMKESGAYWTELNTSHIAGYDFDQAYTDVPSTGTASLGTYAVMCSTYSLFGTALTADQRVITASGRDKDGKQIRTIQLIIEKSPGVSAAMRASGLAFSGGAVIHWGPVQADTTLILSGGACVRYPRKYTKLGIDKSGMAGTCIEDLNPAQPNYDTDNPNPHTEFWTYNEPPGVPTAPAINLPYYKNLAMYSTAAVAAGYPGGGAYYAANQTLNNPKDSLRMVRYGEGNIRLQGQVCTWGVIISMTDVNFAGNQCTVGQAPLGRYPHIVFTPSGAWQEYTKVDTAAAGDYPGDTGGPGSAGLNATYTFGAAADTNIQAQATISHEGFVYSGGPFSAGGGSLIVGAVLAPNDPGGGAGGVSIYYQDNLDIKITGSADFYRSTWRQTLPYWPAGL